MSIKRSSSRPIVALVGRTNVGKSTLWNRLTQKGTALVSNTPHTTRDRNYGTVAWQGLAFELVDTGGMDVESDTIGEGILRQSEHAIREADIVLFVVDGKTGLAPEDRALAQNTRKLNKHVWLVVNKTDNIELLSYAHQPDFYHLGMGTPRPLSATTSLGLGDLLDDILVELERQGRPAVPEEIEKPLRLVFIGRPNVGKSSLVNTILGEERVIVSPIAHTTREPQDTWLTYKEKTIVLVDTAGMRKSSKIAKGIEQTGVDRNLESMDASDVAFLVFDATEDPTVQDRHLAGKLQDTHKGLILVANKWDLVEDKLPTTANKYEALLRQSLPFLAWSPLVFTSAITGQRATKLLDMAIQVNEERMRHIDYNAINKLLKTCIKSMKPLANYGPKSPRIYDVAQVGQTPPTFLITVIGEKENLHKNWIKFFEKRLREKFGFIGTPIVVQARNVTAAKSGSKHNIHGPGMEAVAGKIFEKPRLVNQTRRRQKGR